MKNEAAGIFPGTVETTLSDASKAAVMHHLQSFMDNDLDGVLSDYTDESILITQTGTYTGIQQIRSFFAILMAHFPKQGSSLELDKIVAENDLVYIVWHGRTPTLDVAFGTDTFLLKKGKISQQTFAGQMTEINPVES